MRFIKQIDEGLIEAFFWEHFFEELEKRNSKIILTFFFYFVILGLEVTEFN